MGHVGELVKELDFLPNDGPAVGIIVNFSKCCVYWPTISIAVIWLLLDSFQGCISDDGGMLLLGALHAFDENFNQHLSAKIKSHKTSRYLVDYTPDSKIRIHLPRVPLSGSRVEQVFRRTPTQIFLPAAVKFDDLQLKTYLSHNKVPISPSVAGQIYLSLSLSGH